MFFKSRNISQLTDEELLIDFRKGKSKVVFQTLFDRYVHLVYGLCVNILKDREEAKDAVMDIYEKTILELPEHNVRNFKSWLYVVTKNHCLMHLRKASKQNQLNNFVEFQIAEHPNSEEEIMDGELKHLTACMEKLKHEQQESVNLFYMQKKCYQEIAELMQTSIKSVKSYIQNGKRNLKICIEKLKNEEVS